MIERDEERRRQQSQLDLAKAGERTPSDEDDANTPVPRHARLLSSSHQSDATPKPSPATTKDQPLLPDTVERAVTVGDDDDEHASSALRRFLAEGRDVERADESTPLLNGNGGPSGKANRGVVGALSEWKQRASKITGRDIAEGAFEPVKLLPATILGLLLNVLDGVSYGMIL